MAVERIAVFRALNLGDMLCAVPALRALRNHFPSTDIALIGLPWAAGFQRRFKVYLDRFFAFPGFPGLPEAVSEPQAIDAFFSTIREENFDLCLQLHGSGPVSNTVVEQLGGRQSIGLGAKEPGTAIQVWPYPDDCHEVHRNLRLIEVAFGPDATTDELEFPLCDDDWRELGSYPEIDACRVRPYVCLQPGARNPAKRWPASHFAAVGDALAEMGYSIVLTGSAAENALAQDIIRQMAHPAYNAACDISIGGLAALLSGARLLVSNDTGVAHLAVALKVPSVVIFFATDPLRWAPPADGRHSVAGGTTMPDKVEVLHKAAALLDGRTS